jgi:hypothetical protein
MSALDALLSGYRKIRNAGTAVAERSEIDFVGSSVSVADNPITKRTEISISGVPEGGTTGQVLAKQSSDDGDAAWEDPPSGLPVASAANQILKTGPAPNYTPFWGTISQEEITPAFAIATFAKTAPNTGTLLYRRGDTLTGLTASASYTSGPPGSASIANTLGGSTNVGDTAPGTWTINSPYTSASMSGSVRRLGSDSGADPTMTVTLTATKGTVRTSAFTITWTRDVFWGVGAAGFNTESQIEGLGSSALAADNPRTFSVTPNNQKIYYAYPKAYGLSTFTIGGFSGGFNAPVEVTLTNANGVASVYYVYESTNLVGDGSSTSVVVTQS